MRPYGTGSLFKRGNRWYLRFYRQDGTRTDRAIRDPITNEWPRTKSHAARIANEICGILSGEIRRPVKHVDSLRELDALYCEAFLHRLSPRNQRYRNTVASTLYAHFPAISDITHESLGKFVLERLNTPTPRGPRTPATVNRELAVLRRLLNWAEQTGRIERSPMHGFRLLREANYRERILDAEEIARLLDALDDPRFIPIRLVVLISLFCGLRFGEVAGLRWSDIRSGHREFDLLKTKSGRRRKVPIPDHLWDELKTWPRTSSEYVFPGPCGAPLGSIKKSFRSLLKIAGIEHFRFHDLRHTAASWMLRSGADLNTVREILGHASIATTQRYLTSSEDLKRKAVEWDFKS